MDPLLDLLQKNAKFTDKDLAERLDISPDDVRAKIAAWEADGTIMGYQAVVDPARAAETEVDALIEVSVTPERGGGFDRLAERIARFDQVKSCYLMSGGFDLAVRIHGKSLREVATFVSERLSTIEGVLSTRTHFQLKVYKEDGLMAKPMVDEKRLAIAP